MEIVADLTGLLAMREILQSAQLVIKGCRCCSVCRETKMALQREGHDQKQEAAYRAGYVRGMRAVISAMASKLTYDEKALIDSWTASTLQPWSRIDMSAKTPPPDFPLLPIGRT